MALVPRALLSSILPAAQRISHFLQISSPSTDARSFSHSPSSPIKQFQSLSSPNPCPASATQFFPQRIAKRKTLLETTPIESPKLVLISNLLERYGFPTLHLYDFLKNNGFLLDLNLSDAAKSLDFLLSLGLSQKSLISILFSCPRVLELEFLKKLESGFYRLSNFSNSAVIIQRILEHSGRFQIEPVDLLDCLQFLRFHGVNEFFIPPLLEKFPWLMFLDRNSELEPKLQALKDWGIRDETVTRILTEFLRVVMIDSKNLTRKFEFLEKIGFTRSEIDQICYEFPPILGLGIEDRLKPLLNEIESLGFRHENLKNTIMADPQVLRMEFGELSRCVELLKNLKCRLPTKEKILCKGLIRASIEVKLRVDCLHRHGLTYREAFKLLQREPRSILYNVADIEQKLDFLLNTMGHPICCLIEVPDYLGVSFEKQIVPRYRVIEHLRSRGGLGIDVGLKGLIKPSRLRFYNLYVKPYPECEGIFGKLYRDAANKTRHPVGLWKLFKPKSFPESEEDLRNMKLFMESLV